MTAPDLGEQGRPFTVFVIAGEESGDLLGVELMGALQRLLGGKVRFVGVGGRRMTAAGLTSLFPMEEAALHGLAAVLVRLPRLVYRILTTVSAVVGTNPDVLVLIDVPGFNLRVGRAVRRRNPAVTIVDYVSPSVWAYFPGRARKMARYVDRLLAILPFEPAVHRDLGGPPCVYVGHPLIERLDRLRPRRGERRVLDDGGPPVLLVLPGSRRTEIGRLMAPFGATVARIAGRLASVEVILPAVPYLADEIRERAAAWPVKPRVVADEGEKLAAFRRGHAALAASGTVTLELALAGVPMIVAYRVDPLVRPFKAFLAARSIVLANLVLDANVVPEFLDRDGNPERLAEALMPLLRQSPERARQLAAFARIETLMRLDEGTPSARAAEVVVETVRRRRQNAAREVTD